MLKGFEPQMAVVSLEAAAAPPAIEAALDAACHVFAEKPSCTRAADFEKLVRKAQQKHRHLMLALANRSHAPVREARRLVRAGKLGKVYGVEVHLVTDQTRLKNEEYRKSWFCSKARAGGGQLIWVGIHWLDLALYVTGLKVKQVAGFAGVVGGQPIDVEDSAALSLRFDNGSFGTMTSGYYLDKGYQSHVQVWRARLLAPGGRRGAAAGVVQQQRREGREGRALRVSEGGAWLPGVPAVGRPR